MTNPFDDEWIVQANHEFKTRACPNPDCGERGTVTVSKKFLPTGGSLAGSQMKMSVREAVVLECSACKIRGELKPDD